MYTGKLVFSQLMDFLPIKSFHQCVHKYKGNYKVKEFTCFDQFYSMAFGQLSYRESLRDIITCLNSIQNKLYHMGIRAHIARSTLAKANENRDWRIYADLAQTLIRTARRLYSNEELDIQLSETIYALDSTTIDLCLYSLGLDSEKQRWLLSYVLCLLTWKYSSLHSDYRRKSPRC